MAGLMVDTDVLIDYLRDQPQAATFLESLEEPHSLSSRWKLSDSPHTHVEVFSIAHGNLRVATRLWH